MNSDQQTPLKPTDPKRGKATGETKRKQRTTTTHHPPGEQTNISPTVKAYALQAAPRPLEPGALSQKGERAITMAEEALLRRALGYEYEELTYTRKPIGAVGKQGKHVFDGKEELILTERKTKHSQPDTPALVFLLTNLMPDRWKQKVESNVNERRTEIKELQGMTLGEMLETARRIKAEVERRRIQGSTPIQQADDKPPGGT